MRHSCWLLMVCLAFLGWGMRGLEEGFRPAASHETSSADDPSVRLGRAGGPRSARRRSRGETAERTLKEVVIDIEKIEISSAGSHRLGVDVRPQAPAAPPQEASR